MRPSLLLATFATSAALVSMTLVAPGVANAEETAQQTIARYQSEGYTVNVDRVGSAPIEDCVVTSVRNPQTQTRSIKDYYGPRDENGDRRYRIIQVPVSQSISVSLDCSK
ncbi:MAG: hypothetical protein ABW137_29555 [Mycobacterium sp.]